MTSIERFGYIRDKGDNRDRQYKPKLIDRLLPSVVDLRNIMPRVFDQGNLGSCVGNAVAAQVQSVKSKQQGSLYPTMFSRLFIYYNARAMEGNALEDAGCEIRDAIKSVAKLGACLERSWPYVLKKFSTQPTAAAYKAALAFQALSYERVIASATDLKTALADGYPVACGFDVFQSFREAYVSPYIMPMPKKVEALLGGHAVLAVGYDDSKQCFLMRNSWGANWGMSGYFWMPYNFVNTKYVGDFWVIKHEE